MKTKYYSALLIALVGTGCCKNDLNCDCGEIVNYGTYCADFDTIISTPDSITLEVDTIFICSETVYWASIENRCTENIGYFEVERDVYLTYMLESENPPRTYCFNDDSVW